jgi:hypothetical protein
MNQPLKHLSQAFCFPSTSKLRASRKREPFVSSLNMCLPRSWPQGRTPEKSQETLRRRSNQEGDTLWLCKLPIGNVLQARFIVDIVIWKIWNGYPGTRKR